MLQPTVKGEVVKVVLVVFKVKYTEVSNQILRILLLILFYKSDNCTELNLFIYSCDFTPMDSSAVHVLSSITVSVVRLCLVEDLEVKTLKDLDSVKTVAHRDHHSSLPVLCMLKLSKPTAQGL